MNAPFVEKYTNPLATVFESAFKDMPNSENVGSELKAALLNFFMMGAAASVNALMQGYTFPDNQPVSFSAQELMAEAMSVLGTGDDDEDQDDEDEGWK